ncbi:MAG: potassium/proton antiporter [Candidatus Omnitrophica bacterium]|nr:potassium/proton antiporter [Candidatus Omnitrophota bacterium]
MLSIEYIILYGAALIFLSVVASKLSDRLSVPALLLFLIIGMLAGSEGLGGIAFDDLSLAKSIGIVALVFIIFSGGINTTWKRMRPILFPGFILSTLGVLLTAVIVGVSAVYLLKFSWIEGMLLGAIVSSTDVAAVFTILRSKKMSMKGNITSLLEFESGSNDPMSVFLTIGFIRILMEKNISIVNLFPMFVLDMGMGALVGFFMARFTLFIINKLKLEYTGLYPVLIMSMVLLTYAVAALAKGNGFLAVYIVGLVMSNEEFLHKKSIMRFHDGIAWLMQITMFLTLGLLVFPSHIIPVVGSGLLIALVLVFLARPISIFLCLAPFKFNFAEKSLVAWAGLRGAVPIILATFPLLSNVPRAEIIFNIVFFVVLTSVLIQGTTVTAFANLLKITAPGSYSRVYPIEFERIQGIDASLNDMIVPYNSEVVGKKIFELNVPVKCLIVLISRDDNFIIPNGSMTIEGGDVLLVLANNKDFAALQSSLLQFNKKEA